MREQKWYKKTRYVVDTSIHGLFSYELAYMVDRAIILSNVLDLVLWQNSFSSFRSDKKLNYLLLNGSFPAKKRSGNSFGLQGTQL